MRTIEGVIPVEGVSDQVFWALASSGRFSCKSFRRSIAGVGYVLDMWTFPSFGQIKVNVDDFFLGNSRREGIGGIFKNLEGKMLLQFGKEVKEKSTVHAELLTFREEILVATTSRWVSSHHFMFEPDSKLVVLWVANPSSAPWLFQNTVQEFCCIFSLRLLGRSPILVVLESIW